jgi:hypothetical protein
VLSFGHFFPIYEAVKVVDEKNDETDDDGYIRCVMHCGKNPQNNQDDIVCRIGESKV